MILSLVIVLPTGCAKISGDSYCDITSPLFFKNDDIVDYLIKNDRALVSDIMVSNETYQRICDADI